MYCEYVITDLPLPTTFIIRAPIGGFRFVTGSGVRVGCTQHRRVPAHLTALAGGYPTVGCCDQCPPWGLGACRQLWCGTSRAPLRGRPALRKATPKATPGKRCWGSQRARGHGDVGLVVVVVVGGEGGGGSAPRVGQPWADCCRSNRIVRRAHRYGEPSKQTVCCDTD